MTVQVRAGVADDAYIQINGVDKLKIDLAGNLTLLAPNARVIGSASDFRNRILSGNFLVNQLVKTGTVILAANEYGHDGWKAGAAGCTYTFVKTGSDTVVTITAGSLIQVIGADYNDGGSFCLSWFGTSQGKFGGGPFGNSPQVATNVTAAVALSVEFTTGSLGFVQVEAGLSASPFERKDPEAEWRRARRYFRKSVPRGSAVNAADIVSAWMGLGANTAAIVATQKFEEPMAAVPNYAIYNPNDGTPNQVRNVGNGAALAIAIGNVNEFGLFSMTGAPTAGALYQFNWTASARL